VTVINGQIDEVVSVVQTGATVYVQSDEIDELIGLSQLGVEILAHVAQAAETIAFTDALTAMFGIEIIEQLVLNQTDAANGTFHISAAEQVALLDQLIAALPVTISETMAVTTAEVVQRAITVMEDLGVTADIASSIMYHMTISERIVVADALARFFGAEVIEALALSDVSAAVALKDSVISESVGLNASVLPRFILRVVCDENLDLTADQAVHMIFNPVVNETVELAGAYVAPNGSITTWAMNTRTGGVTEYQNYAFNSFARIGNVYLGAADDGLYELLGDTDDGDDIISTIRSGFAQWSGTHLGSFKAAYLAVAGVGDYVLRVLTRDGKTYNYRVTAADGRTTKVNMGKGLRSRYFAFELVSTGQDFDLDTLEFIPLVADRRV
jgi:hypothetical protein